MNPWKLLFRSRKFWLMILDTVISLVTFFVTKYAAPSAVEDVKVIILTLQPMFVMLIFSVAYEDAARLRAGTPRGM
jgi:hypothetical protein